jgi:hypothetical protein
MESEGRRKATQELGLTKECIFSVGTEDASLRSAREETRL